MIQVKLSPLPVANGAWAAHFQCGKFGIKEQGNYRSAQCLLTSEQAMTIMGGMRSTSFRFSSAEAYFIEDATFPNSTEQDVYFGGKKLPFARQAVLDLLEKDKPINPNLLSETKPLLEAAGSAWEEQHRNFADNQEGNAPKTLH